MYSQQSILKMQKRQIHVKKRAEKEQYNKKIERYFGNQENKFPQVDKLTWEEAITRLRQKSHSHIRALNTVSYGNPQGLKHFVAKSVLVYTLIDKGLHCSTEVLDCDCYIIEFDWGIEIERNYTPLNVERKINKFKKLFQEIFVFDLNKLSDNFNEMQKQFERRLGI